MKKLIFIILFLISICSFGQTFQHGYNSIFDSLYIEDSDTLEQVTLELPNYAFTYVYGINYGSIDSSTILLYIQASIPSMGWTTISDTVTLDSTSTATYYYLTGTTPPYPDIKLMMERDTVEYVLDGWVKTILFTRKIE
jgi:hypothetical protein